VFRSPLRFDGSDEREDRGPNVLGQRRPVLDDPLKLWRDVHQSGRHSVFATGATTGAICLSKRVRR